jgi:replicative DNA helicase
MSNNEFRLITRIIREGHIKDVLAYGITEEDFTTLQGRSVWNNIYSFYKDHATRGSVQDEASFRANNSHFTFVDAPAMSTQAICHELRKFRLATALQTSSQTVVELAAVDPIAAALALRNLADSVIGLGTNKCNDIHLSNDIDRLIKQYEMKEDGTIKPILMWPWGRLNEVAGGIEEEDYILFYGRPKSMKTFVLTYLMAHAYEQGLRVLCYTKEMTPDNIMQRTYSFLANLPYQDVRQGRLSVAHKQSLNELGRHIHDEYIRTNGKNELIVLSGQDSNGSDGVVWLSNKIDQYKPDICFVDGLYLLNDDKGSKKGADWNRVMNISRDIRQMILDKRVPVLATMQANRKAAGHQDAELDEIAYSDAVGQDITQSFRVINEKNMPTIALLSAGSREYNLHGIRINKCPCQDFGFHSEMDPGDVADATKGDSAPANVKSLSKPQSRGGKPRQADIDKRINSSIAAL